MNTDDEKRLQNAAIRFARDYGPLSAAVNGDVKSRLIVADRLCDALMAEGFDLVPPSKKATGASPTRKDNP